MKFVYRLEHKRVVDEIANEIITETKLLGFFSSKKKCKNTIPLYLEQPGFKDYPDDFVIKKIKADVDDYNKVAGRFECYVFYLSHEYYDGKFDYISNLGYYSSKRKAEIALAKYENEPKYKKYLEGFWIGKYVINKREWKEGFFDWTKEL